MNPGLRETFPKTNHTIFFCIRQSPSEKYLPWDNLISAIGIISVSEGITAIVSTGIIAAVSAFLSPIIQFIQCLGALQDHLDILLFIFSLLASGDGHRDLRSCLRIVHLVLHLLDGGHFVPINLRDNISLFDSRLLRCAAF